MPYNHLILFQSLLLLLSIFSSIRVFSNELVLCIRGPKYWSFSISPSDGCESKGRSVVSNSLWPHGLYSPWNSPGQNTGVGSLSLLQGSSQPRSPMLQADSLPAEPQGKPKNIGEQSGLISFRIDWFDFLLSKGLSRVFSNNTVRKHQFFGAQPSLSPTLTSIHDSWKNHSFD